MTTGLILAFVIGLLAGVDLGVVWAFWGRRQDRQMGVAWKTGDDGENQI